VALDAQGIRELFLSHGCMASGAGSVGFLPVMTPHAGSFVAAQVHGFLEGDEFAVLGSAGGVTDVAGVHLFVVTHLTGIRIGFVGLVVKGDKGEFGVLDRGFLRCLHEYAVRLFPVEPGDIGELFDLGLCSRIVTGCTLDRACLLGCSSRLPVAVDAGDVGRQTVGDPVFLGGFQVAIPAGAFLFLYIDEFFRLGVIFVMTGFAFVFEGFRMAGVKGFVEPHGLAIGKVFRGFGVALSAGDGA